LGAAGHRPASRPLFYGWVVVGGAFAILFMAYGAQYSFGVFLSAMLDELGWSRTGLSGAFSLYAFVYTGLALVAGRLTDRWGPRAVIAVGGAFLGAGWVAMGGVREPWHPYVFYGLVAAIGMSAAFVPCSATVARWFVRRRGLAVGLALGGMGLGLCHLRRGHLHRVEPGRHGHAARSGVGGPRPRRRCRTGAPHGRRR